MDSRLVTVLESFHGAVTAALAALEKAGIPMPATNMEWALNRIPSDGELSGGARYRKHGYGCTVTFGEVEVDFDFGPSGEVLPPDAWRLISFCSGRFAEFGFENEAQLRWAYSHAIRAGEIAMASRVDAG